MILFAGVRNVEHVGLERSEDAESETEMKRGGQKQNEGDRDRLKSALSACIFTVQYTCLLISSPTHNPPFSSSMLLSIRV